MASLTLLAACSAALERPRSDWLSSVGRDHPLVGVIWDIPARRPLARETLVERLLTSEFVLLGDKHDNADHHRLQAEIVEALGARGRRPAVAFEPFTVDRRTALASALESPSVTPQLLIEAVAPDRPGWDWDLYAPVLAAALRARLPIVAADLDPAEVRVIYAKGLGGLDTAMVDRLALTEPRLNPQARQQLADEIRRDHCGHAPEAMLDRMVDLQRARDAQLGRALVDAVAAGAEGAILIAGGGHVRRDLAVPLDLERWAPGATIASLAFIEVFSDGPTSSDALAAQFDGRVPFDYVWFTPRVDTTDPCEQFRAPLERLHTKRPP